MSYTRVLLISMLGCLSVTLAHAQYRDELIYGLQFGANYSYADDITTTIIPEPYFTDYKARNKWLPGINVGGFVNLRGTEAPAIAGHAEVSFSTQGGKMIFYNNQTDFNYELKFISASITTDLLVKFYPGENGQNNWKNFNIGTGVEINAVTSHDNIKYKSWNSLEAFGSDLEQQRQLRNVLKARTSYGIVVNIGYECSNTTSIFHIPFPVTFDFRYVLGLRDVLETYPNSYNFIDNYNNGHCFQFKLGYFFPRKS
ncbi:Outer membrane protein beta-barrel domain-containing protein [Chitinophaga sp. YR627]|uniref:outer membrane beta-barrel protein n=1 Tax=Chitinophaga sp. YR627 TaxID=1881041 RepID=UPI0008F06CD5|nr:outer membrane beta-barrel protein [Chitinophaga sp. YR627]SFM90234.1 Outer membrane protein beta-barrel domain-containing protein [Chitinophaga sp. YR627]